MSLAGCTSEYPEPASQSESLSQVDNLIENSGNSAVTKSDINRVVTIFGNGASERISRSQAFDYTVSTINDSEGNPAIYVVNYANNAGFVLISATKDYHPILAYSESGSYDITRFNASGLDIWENNTVDAVKESANLSDAERVSHNIEWLKYSAVQPTSILRGPSSHEYITDEEYEELGQIYLSSINELAANRKTVYPYEKISWEAVLKDTPLYSAENMAKNVYWMYEDVWQDFASLVYWEEYEESSTPTTVQSIWGQYVNYNMAFPKISETEHAYVGCGPLAVGQIMKYWEFPKQYDWSDMALDYATTTTSKFLYDIAIASKAVFLESGTETDIEDLNNTFVQFGYSTSGVKAANPSDMSISLKSGSPVLVSGYNNENKGHAWVAARAKSVSYKLHYDIYNFGARKSYKCLGTVRQENPTYTYFYFNWGEFGNNDGYYLITNHQYRNKMKVINNIKPK